MLQQLTWGNILSLKLSDCGLPSKSQSY